MATLVYPPPRLRPPKSAHHNTALPSPSQELFFGELKKIAPKESDALRSLPFTPMKKVIMTALKRQARLLKFALALSLIGGIFGKGAMLRSVAEAAMGLYAMYSVFGYAGVAVTVGGLRMIPDAVWATFGLPISSSHVTAFVKMALLARSTSRETLEPYLSRVHQQLDEQRKAAGGGPKVKACEVNGVVLASVRKRDAPTLLGFAAPFALLMSVPLFGPLAVIYAQAAAAYVVAPMLTDAERLRKASTASDKKSM